MININIDFNLFTLKKEYFDHQSKLHGIKHTYRVMCNCLYLGDKLKNIRETKLAFYAAFIHDMARKDDGYCIEHGLWAAKQKLPQFRDLFFSIGLQEKDLQEIKMAVINHSEKLDIPQNNPFYKTTAILKDADALDRIRIAENNLNVDYLRFKESIQLIPFAKELYYRVEDAEIHNFYEILKIAEDIYKTS